MSDFNDARTLRLERLESRSLLAAGVFDSVLTTDHQESDHLRHGLQADSSRPHEVAQNVPQSGRIESSPDRQSRRHQDHSRRQRPVDQSMLQSDRIQATPIQQTPTSPANLALTANPEPAAIAGGGDRTNVQGGTPDVNTAASGEQIISILQTPSRDSTSSSTPAASQTQVTARQPILVDAAIASLVSEASTASSKDSVRAEQIDEVSTVDTATSSPVMMTETDDVQQEDAFRLAVGDDISAAEDGLIDLAPLDSLKPFTENSKAWQLDLYAIPSLRQIVQQAMGSYVGGDRVESVDRLMQGWFAGPGGMIGLDQFNLPAVAFPLGAFPFDNAMIDVGLESTVALHRSLNFVADSVTPALSGHVLDAIMASLEQVAAAETQPLFATTPLRIPMAVYPAAAAVVATTIAIASRRKHKHPQSNLHFTDGQS